MEYTVMKEKNTNVVKIAGRLDSTTSPDFEQGLVEYLDPPAGNLLLDFNDLDYISSAGLRVVLNAAKRFRESTWKFAACNMQDHVQEVFEISGFDNFIHIYNSVKSFMKDIEN
ncbi:MAG: STAS domain-containing protein [Desulfopila sp.]